MRRVLIAPWGKPWKTIRDSSYSWEEVEYIFNDDRCRSRSTLPLLTKALNPDCTVVIVLDTALGLVPNNYDELTKEIGDAYKDFINNQLGLRDDVKIIVAPGVGRFKTDDGYVEFKGSLIDFYYIILHELSRILVELDDKAKVYLDISHGINFMPTLTYRAVNEVLGVLAHTKKISLEVYNSEPVVRGVDHAIIHEVESRKTVQPRISAHRLGATGECRLVEPTIEDAELSREISAHARVEKDESRNLNVFLSSIVNGLPLALYKYYPNHNDMCIKLDDVLKTWRDKIICKRGKLVQRLLRFTEDFMRYVRIWIAARSFNLTRKDEVSLKELKDIQKRIFGYYGQTNALIGRSIGDIERRLKSATMSGWQALGNALKESTGGFDGNNFLAHAGLEYNVTEVCKNRDGEIVLRYRKDMRQEIESASLNGLFKG